MRLADPERSKAILIGTAHYQDAALQDIPAVAANVHDLADVLVDPELAGFRRENVRTIVDPDARLGREVARWCRDAQDVVLVYFSGHGLIDARGELLLALTDTEVDFKEQSALPVSQLRAAVSESPAEIRILILDCCFSGRALPEVMADEDARLVGQIDVKGTFALASAPRNLVSVYVPGERNTVFSGELLDVLREGVDNRSPLLALPVVYHHLTRRLRDRDRPVPTVLHTDTVTDFALVRNRRYRHADPAEAREVATATPLRGLAEADELAYELAGRIAAGRASSVPSEWSTAAIDDLSAAATDPTWPILARLRFAWLLAGVEETERAVAAFFAIGSSYEPGVVRSVTAYLDSLGDDEDWLRHGGRGWDVEDLVPRRRPTAEIDPRDLWGVSIAMLFAAARFPTSVRIRAITELRDLGHADDAVRIAHGMLRERDADLADAVTRFLRR